MNHRHALATAVVLSSCLLAGCATVSDAAPRTRPAPSQEPSVAARADVTYLAECTDDSLVQKPATYTLACADANERLEKLTWSGWGEDKAVATGEIVTNLCEPDCASGKDVRYAVRVVADDLAQGEGAATYRTLRVTALAEHPAGTPAEQTYPLPGIDPRDNGMGEDPTPAPTR